MKWVFGILGTITAFSAVAGLSLTELGEYTQVAKKRTQEAVEKAIPISVEIDRMEILLGKLDNQVSKQKFNLAQAKVSLEDANADWGSSRLACQHLLVEMKQLRTTPVAARSDHGCASTTVSVSHSSDVDHRNLQHKLTSYKIKKAACESHAKVVAQQQGAYEKLECQFVAWQNDRKLLQQRLESLRVRYQAQQLASTTDAAVFDDAELARATKLADKIEREIRISEAQQQIGSEPNASTLQSPIDPQQLEAEVDAILGGNGI